ncbi:MAG: TatD family hydrolase [Betaproteobacteria bacterium]|nr:TatD family hydrolase [Betaproteobacteria bacterium]MCH9849333.1 TatD family hydrolase [Betaproteobacteria bacterium]
MNIIDTHCHLDAAEFDADREQALNEAIASGVSAIVIPAVTPDNFAHVAALSQQYPQCCYALGMHPMYVDNISPSDVARLSALVSETMAQENKLVAIGEIGLDFYVTKQNKETQEYFFSEQLNIAQVHDLPVILHVRGAIDDVLKHLRRTKVKGGIAHAFNGSMHQAEAFIELGFKLGFGGAMTYSRALKIRDLAKNLPLEAIVLETDAPDMPPAWLEKKARNSPKELLLIATTLADLRGIPVAQIIEITRKNSFDVLPKIANLYTRVEALH